MADALNCVAGDLAFVRPSKDISPKLHDRIVSVVCFLGDMRCPCCADTLRNVWMCELSSPIALPPWQDPTGLLRTRFAAIQDKDLRPIRPGKDPEGVETARPLAGVPA